MFNHAITRKPGKDFAQGITTSDLGVPDYELIIQQHNAYVETLQNLGLEVIVLEPLPDYPDAYFVEDTAVVTTDVAIITNPGAETRKSEVNSIEPILAKYRKTARIEASGTVDGGDVLMADRHFFIGLSQRTNKEGARQLGQILSSYGHSYTCIKVSAGLHLKSSINYIGKNSLIITEDYASKPEFKSYEKIVPDKSEEYVANSLLINENLMLPKGFPLIKKVLIDRGFSIIELNVSEIRKMDGGLTCLSLRF